MELMVVLLRLRLLIDILIRLCAVPFRREKEALRSSVKSLCCIHLSLISPGKNCIFSENITW